MIALCYQVYFVLHDMITCLHWVLKLCEFMNHTLNRVLRYFRSMKWFGNVLSDGQR